VRKWEEPACRITRISAARDSGVVGEFRARRRLMSTAKMAEKMGKASL